MFGGAGAADLGAALQRFGQLLSTSSGPVHWQLAHDTARQVVAAEGDPSVSSVERAAVAEAFEIAEVWLDDATTLPSAGHLTRRRWSRAEWVEQTLPRWKSWSCRWPSAWPKPRQMRCPVRCPKRCGRWPRRYGHDGTDVRA